MVVLSRIKSNSVVKYYSKELPFYNKLIQKPEVKPSKKIDQLIELPFYEQLDVIKTDQAFSGYAMSYKVEIIEKKDPIVQLKGSKLSIKNLFNDLLKETEDLFIKLQ